MSQFDEPEEFTGVRLNPGDILGHTLLVWAVDYKEHSPTRFSTPDKKSDVIVVDLVDLDLYDEYDNPGLLARRQWWRQGRLIQTLRNKIGSPRPMLVMMDKGTGAQGYAAPYVLTSMSGDDKSVARANEWFARHPGHEPSKPDSEYEYTGTTNTINSVADPWNSNPVTEAQPRQHRPTQPAQSSNPTLDRLRAQAERNRARLPKPPDEPGF